MMRGVCVAACLGVLCACAPREQSSTEVLMGTFVEVTSADPRAAGIVFGEMRRIEAPQPDQSIIDDVQRVL